MMTISALPPSGAAAAGPEPVASAVTVTIALTSLPPAGRYGFWSMSTWNPGRPVIVLSCLPGGRSPGPRAVSNPCPWPDAVGHVHQFDPPLGYQVGERAVAALEPEAQRPLVRLAAEDRLAGGRRRAVPPGGRRRRHPVERGAQDLHGELVPARVVVVER